MANCVVLSGCPFFNDKMVNAPKTAEMLKRRYCLDDYASCARYMVFSGKGKEYVPADLFPNQQDRAGEILKAA